MRVKVDVGHPWSKTLYSVPDFSVSMPSHRYFDEFIVNLRTTYPKIVMFPLFMCFSQTAKVKCQSLSSISITCCHTPTFLLDLVGYMYIDTTSYFLILLFTFSQFTIVSLSWYVRYVLSCPILSCHVMSYHILSSHAMPRLIRFYHVLPCHILLFHVMFCRAMPCHVLTCRAVSYPVLSYHVLPCRVLYFTLLYYTIL